MKRAKWRERCVYVTSLEMNEERKRKKEEENAAQERRKGRKKNLPK